MINENQNYYSMEKSLLWKFLKRMQNEARWCAGAAMCLHALPATSLHNAEEFLQRDLLLDLAQESRLLWCHMSPLDGVTHGVHA